MEFNINEAPEQPEKRNWASNFFGNVAFAMVIVGGLLTGQGFGGTVILFLELVAVLFALTMCAALVPGALKSEPQEQVTTAIGVLLCIAAVVIVLIG
jgi:hypothetical protein